ncbi:SoxR reducing system RseC family protein [Aliikangiella coralliicola]|uniref:SoxR reducing system RseC family protein n=1 Tax=Aliikangiella coralliicola TaxID=2592383 RepID=A0A545U687_9GAMM|nr:SoxR reducing system RseC family protein [Aliikangiella coralliicola]TQV84990.1 SoxR reducing system RseC family protein [Aliikangiella coralliicola]
MLQETGLVTKIENDIVWVNTQSKLACSSCKVESTCGNAILEKYLSGKVFVSKIKNELGAKVGDEVIIEIPKASVTRASFIAYVIPLFGLIMGAVIGEYWLKSELASIAVSFFGLICGLAYISFYNRKQADNERYTPKMVSKVSTSIRALEFDSIKVKNIE